MDSRILYEEAVNAMSEMLNDTIRNFTGAYDTARDYFHSEPLFYIASPKLDLLKSVSHFSNYQTRNTLATLCKKFLVMFGYAVADCKCKADVDFYVLSDDKKTGYCLSMKEDYMPNIDNAVADGMTNHVVVVLKSNTVKLPPNSFKYRDYQHKSIIRIVSLKEFFDEVSLGEYEIFEEYIGRFNYDAEMMLGFTVSPIPTQRGLQKTWEKVKTEFYNYFFEKSLKEKFTIDEIDVLKKRFQSVGILNVSSGVFVDSFISSEWYFDLLERTDGELEQTAIVTGYLKSIEQLLFVLMLSRSDVLQFKLYDKSKKLVPLSPENQSDVLSMAGNLLKSININYGQRLNAVYFDGVIGQKVQTFLYSFVQRTRNGYFHKDNIYTLAEIQEIRQQAYCAYFLLGSAFILDLKKVKMNAR